MIIKNKQWNTRNLILCALFADLMAIGAFIKIPVPIVPFTLQFLFTNLAGLLLGNKLGAVSVAIYIAMGLLGIPVFTGGGGIGYILKPTFGYIMGFMAGAWLTGFTVGETKTPSYKRLLAAGFAGLGIVYLFGMFYYYIIANYYMNSPIGVWTLILYGFILAVPGDIVICFTSAVLAKRLIPITRGGKL